MSQFPYINESIKDEHRKENNAKAVDNYVWDVENLTWVRQSGNSNGESIVSSPGVVDDGNSTATALGIDEVFTGTAKEVLGWDLVLINIFTDQVSATDGLSIQFSSDGTNWDHSDDYTIPANSGKNYSIQRLAKYFRVVYTNGGVAQTTFRLQAILGKITKPSSHRIKDTIVGDDDAELVKAALTGINGDGNWHNVKTTSDGFLEITDQSSGLSIAKGNVSGHSFIHKFGQAPDFDQTDGEVTVWDGAEDATTWENMVYDYSTTADIQYLSSSNAGDTLEIEVQGLDSNYDLVTQTKTLTGQTSVTLDTPLIRVFRMKNTNGTDLLGHVFCSTTTAGAGGVPTAANIRAIIQPGNNQTLMAIYTIPAGYTGYMRDWYATTAGASKNSNYLVKLRARPFGGVFQLKHVSALNETGSSYIKHDYTEPEIFSEKTDIEISMSVLATGATAASVAAGFDIVLVKN